MQRRLGPAGLALALALAATPTVGRAEVPAAGAPEAAAADEGDEALPLAPIAPPGDALPLAPLPPAGYERLEAVAPEQRPDGRAPEADEGAREGAAPPRLAVIPRAGVYLPFGDLPVGPTAGLSFTLDLTAFAGLVVGEGRVDLRLDLGWARSAVTRAGIVPGRGFDAGFTQDSHLVPWSAAASWRLDESPVRPYGLAGVGGVYTASRFTAFSQPTDARAAAFMGLLGGGLTAPAGPGEAGLEALLRFAGVDLGPLGSVGETTLTGLEITASYAIRF